MDVTISGEILEKTQSRVKPVGSGDSTAILRPDRDLTSVPRHLFFRSPVIAFSLLSRNAKGFECV